MKKKSFGIVLLILAAFNIITREFWNPFIRWAKFWPLLGIAFFCLSISWSFVASSLNFSLFYIPSGLNDC